jgi:calcineurin-like phosphoesterase family protein
MNYWLISDTHFNHTRLEEWGGRSGSWQRDIWSGLRAIPQGDALIHLGDICIGHDREIHEMLSEVLFGKRRILVRGNHDKASLTFYNERWDFVCDGLELIFNGHYLHLTHRPARPHGNASWNIHGHTHGNMHRSEEYLAFYDKNYHIDISPELVGFAPVRLDLLLKGRRG